MSYHQADWNEPHILERSTPGKKGHLVQKPSKHELEYAGDINRLIPDEMKRKKRLHLPEISEVEVVRHFLRLSQQNYSVDFGIYPLGSCTMKYTPKITDRISILDKIRFLHPNQENDLTQGILQIFYELEKYLTEIVGMDSISLQPAAGAQGELTGALIIRAYHKLTNDHEKRNEIIIPDTAHGTNPASAAMAGFKIIVIPSDSEGMVDLEALKSVVGEKTAGLMITNPNTLGLFEKNILSIAKIIHDVGGLLYYDGANLNAILGKVRPGDMGCDIAHINLHKTFSTPHGGGGPGAGPVCVKKDLEKFLPVPRLEFDGKKYSFNYNKKFSIGKIKSYYGNTTVLLRAYSYILMLGSSGLERVSELSVLNANYIAKNLINIPGFSLPYGKDIPRKHEVVISADQMYRDTQVRALDISKRLLDFGIHAPTNYFPLIVPEALMIEPTETENKEELDRLIDAIKIISKEAYSNPKKVKDAPSNTTVTRIDELAASHPKTLCLSWRMEKNKQK